MDNLKRLGLVGVLGATAGLGGCGAMMQEVAYRHPDPLVGQNLGVLGRLVSAVEGGAGNSSQRGHGYRGSTAHINNVWVENNVVKDEQRGMNIHVAFEIVGDKGRSHELVAYFCHRNKGIFRDTELELMDKDGLYKLADGQVATGVKNLVCPAEEGNIWNDCRLFIPYKQLDLEEPGDYKLRFRTALFDYSGNKMAESDPIDFNYYK